MSAPLDPCARCGRTLLDLRAEAGREALRGAAPLCAVPGCPLVAKVLGFAEGPREQATGNALVGASPPAVFVGRHGYPRVAVGPLVPALPERVPGLGDSPREWARDLSIADVLALRARLVRSKADAAVDAPARGPHALDAARELALSARPVETEITLAKPARLRFEPKVDAFAAPMGPSVDVVDARLLSSPRVPRRVDALVSDVHADAATGTGELYEAGISPYHIQRLLSVGLLGEERRRRLVPTRWSITATDDILGKRLIEEVRTFPTVDAPQVFAGDLFGNFFHVVLLPRAWAYEMIETWREGPGGAWKFGHDLERNAPRTDYASDVKGAYYAARLSVLEHLVQARRQATVFVYREITEDYWAPLGVWVIREAVRVAMEGKGLVFEDVESALRHVLRRSRATDWIRVATLPRDALVQRTLRDFL